jgi:hypothetical protein
MLTSKPEYTDSEFFSYIYERRIWGDVSPSGESALPSSNQEYLDTLTDVIGYSPGIRSVIDFGCGDYSLFFNYAWPTSIDYLGVDIVNEIIGDNLQLYTKPNVSFKPLPSWKDTPKGDILLCKDVFQYWEADAVIEFCAELLPKYGQVLLAYDLPNPDYLEWRSHQKQYDNFYSFYEPKGIIDLCGLNPQNTVEYTYPKYEVNSGDNMDILEFSLTKQVLVINNAP